ncbi:MAG: Spx/MgsR family RNA polymerase-binding regulatory protein [Bacteroidota bacterium]
MYVIYGIPNCDTIAKVLSWFKENKIPYEFHDYKKNGILPAKLKTWCGQVGWEILLNKRGTTWKELDAEAQALVTNEKAAIKLMVENTSSIKRPVIEKGDRVITVGFNATAYEGLFKK